eukprot:3776332-Rhodomonas_salina.1
MGWGLATTSDGEVIYADTDWGRVLVMDKETGARKVSITPAGQQHPPAKPKKKGPRAPKPSRFAIVVAVAVSKAEDRIAVCDFGADCVYVFDRAGALLQSHCHKAPPNPRGGGSPEPSGPRVGSFSGPSGVCFDNDGNLIVAESTHHRIQVQRGAAWVVFGSKGTRKGQFDRPWGVAVNSAGEILVADSGNNRIQVRGCLQLPRDNAA